MELATSLERDADAAGAAFDRDAPLAAGGIQPGPLGADTRVAAERSLGAPLDDVRVHTGPDAAGAAQRAGASAFAFGSDVVVGARRGADRSAERRLLAHELAHVVQQRRPGVGLQRAPDPPPPAGGYPTISQVLTDDGTAFRPGYEQLQERYDRYKQGRANPAPPARWVKLARDSNRAALLAVLGPNLGDPVEPENPDEVDVLRLAELRRPAGYTPEKEREDLELLRRFPGALDRKLTTIPADQLQRGEIGGGYVRIATGIVGEALAEPLLQQRLTQLRAQYPDAQIFRNVRVRMVAGTNADGTKMLSNPLEFSDGIVGRITGSGLPGAGLMLQMLYVQEVKGGARGGQEATEQIFRWIEHNIEEGARIVLENGLEFEYDPTAPGGVRGLMSSPRGLVAGRGAAQLGTGSSMGVAGPVERITLARTPEEMRYLSGLLLQSIWARDQLRRLQATQRTAYEATSVAEFMDVEVVNRILTEHNGLAVASGRLYQLRSVGGELAISERPVVSLAFVYPPGTRLPGSTPALPPGLPPPRQLGPGTPPPAAPPPPQPQLPPPAAPPTPQLGPGGAAPAEAPLPPLPALRPATEIQRGAVPATALGEWLPRVGGVGGEWVIWDGRVRDAEGRPVTGYQDGEIWIRVIGPGGRPLPEIDPATGSPAPTRRVMTPEGPRTLQPTPYESPGARTPGTATRVAAGGLSLIMVANEILGPIAAARGVQQQYNARIAAQIRFFTEFGGEPRWAIENMDKPPGAAPLLPWQTEQSIGAVWGAWRAPKIVGLNVPALLDRLPGRLPDFQSLVMFLATGRQLQVIEQQGARYFLTVPGVPYTEITETVERIRSERLRAVDEQSRAELMARGGQGIYRIRSTDTVIHRYATSVRRSWRLASFQSPILTASEFLGPDAWVRDVGDPSRNDRLHVEPANAQAAAVAQNALYIVHKDIESVYEEVEGAGREITSRQPPDGRLEGFTAGPFPPELGPTRYVRHPHPDAANLYTVAIGQLLQFWVDRDKLEPVSETDVSAYARGTPTAPPPSRFFKTEQRQDLPLI